MIHKGSRYSNVEIVQMADGERVVRYLKIRMTPNAKSYNVHSVKMGDRLDHIAFKYLKNPELYWKICDSNDALWPPDLVRKPGRRISIPSSEG